MSADQDRVRYGESRWAIRGYGGAGYCISHHTGLPLLERTKELAEAEMLRLNDFNEEAHRSDPRILVEVLDVVEVFVTVIEKPKEGKG